jgi:hypothetical protein
MHRGWELTGFKPLRPGSKPHPQPGNFQGQVEGDTATSQGRLKDRFSGVRQFKAQYPQFRQVIHLHPQVN